MSYGITVFSKQAVASAVSNSNIVVSKRTYRRFCGSITKTIVKFKDQHLTFNNNNDMLLQAIEGNRFFIFRVEPYPKTLNICPELWSDEFIEGLGWIHKALADGIESGRIQPELSIKLKNAIGRRNELLEAQRKLMVDAITRRDKSTKYFK